MLIKVYSFTGEQGFVIVCGNNQNNFLATCVVWPHDPNQTTTAPQPVSYLWVLMHVNSVEHFPFHAVAKNARGGLIYMQCLANREREQ